MHKIDESIPYKKFTEFSSKYIPKIDDYINFYYKKKAKNREYPFMREMYSQLNDYCRRRGKRIRPLILLIAYNGYMSGAKKMKEIVKLASAVEIMHSFLLIQDDVIDRSDLRRGEKALHIICSEKYGSKTYNKNIGNDVALILADVLFADAIDIICNAGIDLNVKNEFLKIFSSTYEMTAWGQILDILHTMPKEINVKENVPMRVSRLKTAYYTIYYPMLMGYILAGGKMSAQKKQIEKFSLPLGLAFQIRDDINGVFGDVKNTGKPDDSDIIEGKLTLLIQETFDILQDKERDDFVDLISLNRKRKIDIKKIRSAIKDSGALDQAEYKHSQLIKEAEKNLIKLKICDESKIILKGIIELVKVI